MFFEHLVYDNLPKMSWLLSFEKNTNNIQVIHGSSVEIADNFFFEGGWDGEFSEGDIVHSANVFGSGAVIENNTLTIVPPSHNFDKLVSIQLENKILFSNSLNFLLSYGGLYLDDEYLMYVNDLHTMMNGLEGYKKTIPVKNGKDIQIHYYHNIIIQKNLDIRYANKCEPADFTDFRSYKSYLEKTIDNLYQNLNDQRRTVNYSPVTSISSGYDAPTCAVLANSVLNCQHAVTFKDALVSDESDSGKQIAECLGIAAKEFDRFGYLKSKGEFPEAEFLATMPSSLDLCFFTFEKELSQTIFFTGFSGDLIWERNADNDPFIRLTPSGAGLTEFRLRLGFVHIPIPLIGAAKYKSIHKISRSSEMLPWSLFNDYDRPICRRIVEEAGVDRKLFGQKKLMGGVSLYVEGYSSGMKDQSYKDFSELCTKFNRNDLLKFSSKYRKYYNTKNISHKIVFYLMHKLGLFKKPNLNPEFLWGVSHLKDRYNL